MPWHARLALDYTQERGRSVARFSHQGPLRILQSLYPEGGAVCHSVLVHPPGGLVAGDTLELSIRVAEGAHGLLTTPGASRFYRSEGEPALQHTRIEMEAGGRFEWMPLEAIYYSGCQAENRLQLKLLPGAELIGWDIAALGLPQAGQHFNAGSVLQHLELQGQWLERGRIAAADVRMMEGPLGLAGRRCLATLFLAAGSDIGRPRRELALETARQVIEAHALRETAGATAPCAGVVAVRVLAPGVEAAIGLLKAVRAAWRLALWDLAAHPPRSWAV